MECITTKVANGNENELDIINENYNLKEEINVLKMQLIRLESKNDNNNTEEESYSNLKTLQMYKEILAFNQIK